ncbi:TPR-repeat-containing protein [Strigomonas culicis]|uniref:TPR-repeat-containing protein n=1 Tax=Strigomonas culicis TaxID=28005 RepID=S9WK74_9TRYP|nr:TPR-repeat-containing protein [Strigomonas culicis]|eukprot:EPY36365.1 TPR-repeat-containing protein [Strigomonas culicis]
MFPLVLHLLRSSVYIRLLLFFFSLEQKTIKKRAIMQSTLVTCQKVALRSLTTVMHSGGGLCRVRGPHATRTSGTSLLMSAAASASALCMQRRYVGPRQYAPKGYREAAGRAPMTFEFGEECNQLAKTAYQSKNYGDAISLFDRCLTMRREKYGPIHTQCAETLSSIGRVFMDMREYGAAENALTEAAAIYEEKEGATSIKYAEALEMLALAYVNLKFLDEAEKAFKESIRVFRDHCYNHANNSWLPDAPATPPAEPQKDPLASAAHALADCATLFLMRGQQHEAIVFLEESLEIRRFLYSRHHKFRPMIAQTLNKLCELKKSVDDAVGAELCINECLNICVETMGRDHPATAQATSSKAGLLAARKQFREALRLYEESTTTYAVALGKDSPIFGQELVKLGRIQELCNDLQTAEKTYKRGIGILAKTFGPNSLQIAEANTFLASLLVKKLEMDEAFGLFREAIRIRKGVDAKDPQLAYLYQKMGDAYAMRRETHAESYFLLAIEAFKENAKVEPLQRTYMTDVLDDLGLFYLDFQHFEKAEKCFKEALDTRMEMLGENHATVAYSYSNFSLLYLQRQDYAQCEKFALAALDMYGKTAKSNYLAQADVYTTLGQCKMQQQLFSDALQWHEKALNIRRTRGESTETAVAESLNHMARVYLGMKQYGKCYRHVQEAKRIVAPLNVDMTQSLRSEIGKTEAQLPPMDEWTNEERAEAHVRLPATARDEMAKEQKTSTDGKK